MKKEKELLKEKKKQEKEREKEAKSELNILHQNIDRLDINDV